MPEHDSKPSQPEMPLERVRLTASGAARIGYGGPGTPVLIEPHPDDPDMARWVWSVEGRRVAGILSSSGWERAHDA